MRWACLLLTVLVLAAPARAQQLAKFRAVKVSAITHETEELVALTLDLAGTDLAESYEIPGQFVQVRTGEADKPGFFALANAPDGSGHWDLLVKTGTPLTDKLAALAAGGTLEVTPAQGSGFPIAEHRGEDMVILAMGSGISAGRALLEFALAHRADFGAITLIVGGKTPAHLAYRSRVDAWTQAGAKVVQSISNPQDVPGYSGPTGWVQDQLTAPMLIGRPTGLYVIGSKEMMQGVTAKLAELNLPRIKPLTNF